MMTNSLRVTIHNPVILIYILLFASYFCLKPIFGHIFSSPEPKAHVRYANEYVDGLLSLFTFSEKYYI